jgi:transcription-repair coupling factor (superfamily II helicase)
MALSDLITMMADEPALVSILGRREGSIVIPEPARAITISSLVERAERRPVVVGVPTTAEAERLVHDLAAFLGSDEVELFPAWETLPFERVSPAIDTMGRRSRVLWRLHEPERAPAVIVAPVRALVQRLGPHVGEIEPITIGVGDVADPVELIEQLVSFGYRREVQVEHRGEVAVRGSIVDIYPSTADVPIRIDLWGDEVDRLTEFSIADQRATVSVAEATFFPCR